MDPYFLSQGNFTFCNNKKYNLQVQVYKKDYKGSRIERKNEIENRYSRKTLRQLKKFEKNSITQTYGTLGGYLMS